MKPIRSTSRTPPMSKPRSRKHKRFRRLAMRCGGVLAWVTLIYFLPPVLGNVVAVIGLVVEMFAYMKWAHDDGDSTGHPSWGCMIVPTMKYKISALEYKLSMSPELRAKFDNEINRRMLLRPTEAEGCPQQELLRSATSGKADPPEEMLRSSEKPE